MPPEKYNFGQGRKLRQRCVFLTLGMAWSICWTSAFVTVSSPFSSHLCSPLCPCCLVSVKTIEKLEIYFLVLLSRTLKWKTLKYNESKERLQYEINRTILKLVFQSVHFWPFNEGRRKMHWRRPGQLATNSKTCTAVALCFMFSHFVLYWLTPLNLSPFDCRFMNLQKCIIIKRQSAKWKNRKKKVFCLFFFLTWDSNNFVINVFAGIFLKSRFQELRQI